MPSFDDLAELAGDPEFVAAVHTCAVALMPFMQTRGRRHVVPLLQYGPGVPGPVLRVVALASLPGLMRDVPPALHDDLALLAHRVVSLESWRGF
jgi:hypothetical protein